VLQLGRDFSAAETPTPRSSFYLTSEKHTTLHYSSCHLAPLYPPLFSLPLSVLPFSSSSLIFFSYLLLLSSSLIFFSYLLLLSSSLIFFSYLLLLSSSLFIFFFFFLFFFPYLLIFLSSSLIFFFYPYLISIYLYYPPHSTDQGPAALVSTRARPLSGSPLALLPSRNTSCPLTCINIDHNFLEKNMPKTLDIVIQL